MAIPTQDVGLGAAMQQRATPYTPRNGSKVERATLTNVTACSPSRDTGPADQVFFRTRRPPRRRELILKGMRTQRCTDATVRLQVDSASTGHQRQMTCQGPQTAPASEKRTEEGASICRVCAERTGRSTLRPPSDPPQQPAYREEGGAGWLSWQSVAYYYAAPGWLHVWPPGSEARSHGARGRAEGPEHPPHDLARRPPARLG